MSTDRPVPRRIDTHQHLWDLERFDYSWTKGFPALCRSFRMEDYRAAASGLGVEKTVFVECDVDEPHALDEARQVEGLARQHPLIAGLVAAARPERADFPAQLDALLEFSRLRGIRRVLHVVPDEISRSGLFAENVRRLARHGLTFDLCVLARQLPLAADLVKQCPDVQFVLDHCGVPDVAGGVVEPWRSDLAVMAGLPNVVCKISGLPAYAGEGWTVEQLRLWVEQTIACFGWDRVLWASDWPVCTLASPLARWVEACDTIVAGASDGERDRLFRANAERIYRI
jgi:predicted TIM-barrel fold metal-dependent hydrolase